MLVYSFHSNTIVFRFSLLSFQHPCSSGIGCFCHFYYLFGALKCASLNRNLITNVIITMGIEEHSHSHLHNRSSSVRHRMCVWIDVVVFVSLVFGIVIVVCFVRLCVRTRVHVLTSNPRTCDDIDLCIHSESISHLLYGCLP